MRFLPMALPVYQHAATIRYAVDTAAGLIWEEWAGDVSAKDLGAHWSGLLENAEAMHCRHTLVSLAKARIHVRGCDLSGLIESLVTPGLAGRKWITAIVVSSDFQYGLSRQYGAYADLYSTDQIFKDVPSALAWIRDKRHTA